jgi:hypothetical protein
MSVLSNLGYVASATYFPCASPRSVIVIQAAAKAAGITLLQAVTFGCRDIVKLRAGISPWHTRGMRALVNGAIKPSESGDAGKLLKFLAPAEKAFFFYFVVDLTVGFAANWQSQIFQMGACQGQNTHCTWSGDLASWVEPAPQAWTPIAYQSGFNPPSCQFGGTIGFLVPANYYYSAYFSMKPRPIFAGQPVGECTLRLHRIAPFETNVESQPQTPPWFGNNFTANLSVTSQKQINDLQRFEFQAKSDVPAIGEGGSLVVQIAPFPILNTSIIPLNCFGKPAPSSQAIA